MLESVEVKQGTRYIKESWLLAAEEFFFNAFGRRRGEWHRCSSLQQFETTHDDSHDCLSSLHSSPNVKEEPEHTGEASRSLQLVGWEQATAAAVVTLSTKLRSAAIHCKGCYITSWATNTTPRPSRLRSSRHARLHRVLTKRGTTLRTSTTNCPIVTHSRARLLMYLHTCST